MNILLNIFTHFKLKYFSTDDHNHLLNFKMFCIKIIMILFHDFYKQCQIIRKI